jgi:hypothetical protein
MLPLIPVLTLPLLLSAPQGSGNAVSEAADRAELEGSRACGTMPMCAATPKPSIDCGLTSSP